MAYSIALKASADKSLDAFAKTLQARILQRISALAGNPRPSGSIKLAGPSGLHRIRIGDYRVLYLIDDKRQTIDVRIIAHRRDVYRDL